MQIKKYTVAETQLSANIRRPKRTIAGKYLHTECKIAMTQYQR